MRTMYDAVNVNAAIPDNPEMIAGYIDGNYQSFAGLAARFPNAIHVPIAVWPSTNDGLVLDVELGDATPEQAPAWCEMRRAAGVIPSVYCGQSAWQTVRDQFVAQGVTEPPYWVASYPGPGEGVMIPGAVAHQWGGDTDGGYDVSVVADFWPGVDTSPVPPQPVPPTPEELMSLGPFIVTYPCKAGPAAVLFNDQNNGKKVAQWMKSQSDIDAAVLGGAKASVATQVSDNFVAGYNWVGDNPTK